jgi:hypothetical protein
MKKYICICNKNFNTITSLTGHRPRCKIYLQYKKSILTKKFLEDNLIAKNYTANHISLLLEEQGIHFTAGSIINEAKKYGIKTKTISESKLNKLTKEKYENTCLEKYGIKNTFQCETTKNTLREKYGEEINNVSQLPFVVKKIKEKTIEWYSNPENMKKAKERVNTPEAKKNKIEAMNRPEVRKNNSEKQKKHYNSLSEVEKNNHILKRFKSSAKPINKSETIVLNLLNQIFPKEWKYTGDLSLMINGKNPDFVNKNNNKIIELYGDYWHRNDNPQDRIDIFKPFGYDTLVIRECELKDINKVIKKIIKFNNKENKLK